MGVVICNPFGQEYLRSHRSLRELAGRLARAGFDVLRFDYYGCGDSAGESEQGTLEQWLLDISSAMAEVREASGSPELALVGLRLGGSLAAMAAEQRGDVARLVLWDAILDGAAYLRELHDAHQVWLHDHAHRAGASAPGPLREALGFPLSPALSASIASLRIDGGEGPSDRVLTIDHRSVPGGRVWLHDDGLDRTLVPHAVLDAIESWLMETPR